MANPPPASISTLAKRLATDDASSLTAALEVREPRTVGVRDAYDLAEQLLAPTCLDRGLARFTAAQLTDIAASRADANTLSSAAQLLLGASDELFPETVARAQHWVNSLAKTSPATSVDRHVGNDSFDSATASARDTGDQATEPWDITDGLIHVSLLGDVVLAAGRMPLLVGRTGGLLKGSLLELSGAVPRSDVAVADLVQWARDADLLEERAGRLNPTSRALDWQAAGLAGRWSALVTATLASLDPAARRLLTASGGGTARLTLAIRNEFPIDNRWLVPSLDRAIRTFTLLGLIDNTGLSPELARSLVSADASSPIRDFASRLPSEMSDFLIQHDMSIVAPGPLTADVERRLNAIARIESRGLASTYRLSAASVSAGLTSGETADGILEFLASHSQTPVPQNVDYLIRDIAGRHGTIRLARNESGTLLTTATPALLDALMVDPRLRVLQFTRLSPDTATSRVDARTIAQLISDGGYPVPLVDEKATDLAKAGAVATNGWAEIVERVQRARTPEDGDWMTRELDLAVRGKQRIRVTVAMPDGERDFVLDPASLANGRLRGRDVRGAVERTLPVDFITAVAAAE